MEIIKERICGCEIVSGDKEWDECRFFSDDLDDVMMFGKKRNGSRVDQTTVKPLQKQRSTIHSSHTAWDQTELVVYDASLVSQRHVHG